MHAGESGVAPEHDVNVEDVGRRRLCERSRLVAVNEGYGASAPNSSASVLSSQRSAAAALLRPRRSARRLPTRTPRAEVSVARGRHGVPRSSSRGIRGRARCRERAMSYPSARPHPSSIRPPAAGGLYLLRLYAQPHFRVHPDSDVHARPSRCHHQHSWEEGAVAASVAELGSDIADGLHVTASRRGSQGRGMSPPLGRRSLGRSVALVPWPCVSRWFMTPNGRRWSRLPAWTGLRDAPGVRRARTVRIRAGRCPRRSSVPTASRR